MLTSAKVIKHSVTDTGRNLYTLELRYPRFIHGEFMTHRSKSRNASSSRAIPITKMIKNVLANPAQPIVYGSNKAGMQAGSEIGPIAKFFAKTLWYMACYIACAFSYLLSKTGLHKQHCNRITEPFQYITVLASFTESDNFFKLRNHKDAQPEIEKLANLMKQAMLQSKPEPLTRGWHLPYITQADIDKYGLRQCVLMSAARCARVSYLNHDGTKACVTKDIELHDLLVGSEPMHMSPTEHQAKPSGNGKWYGNFRGWKQYRWFLERDLPIA